MWIVILLLSLLPSSASIKITEELTQQMKQAAPNAKVSCIVIMKETYPYDAVESRSVREKIAIYRKIAQESQQAIIEWLETIPSDAIIHQRFWVLNGFHLEAKPDVIIEVARRNDVGWISHDGEVHIIAQPSFAPAPSSRVIEWNIQKVMADSCWTAGFTGQGIILGETDTGVDYQHPALQNKWAGYWRVAQGLPPSNTPYDDHGHGTHCMGTIMGGDGFGPFDNDIGMAPGARFVAAKVLNSGGSGSFTQCIEGLQWHADLKESVDVKAVSNSWGASTSTDSTLYPVCRTLKSVGILPVFANGNDGSQGPGSARVPGNYSVNLGIGATDNNDNVAGFSSRGPAPNQPPWNDRSTWYRSDWNFIKPNISAPGVNIRSSTPGGNYASWQGTSMATPHVTGAVGIICQKNQSLSPTTLYSILLDNVDEPSQGAPYPNNDYGWGRLNVWKALKATPASNVPYIILQDRLLSDSPPGGNNNGLLEPGETVKLRTTIRNIGANSRNVTGKLLCRDNYITISDDSSYFGNILQNGQATNANDPYVFTAHSLTPQGHKANFGLVLSAQGDSGNFCDTTNFTIQIGTPPPPYAIYQDDYEYGSGIDSFLNYWSVSANWTRSNAQSHSPPYSMYNGGVKANYEVQLRNSVNLTPFASPQLSFWHTYNFNNGIWCRAYVDVSTNGGTNWTNLWAYDWMSGNTIPWTERVHSLSSYVSSNFKVRYRVEINNLATTANWYIDDFKLFAAADNEPPYFTNTTVWRDTNFTGPFPVRSTITDVSKVDSAYLYYRVNSGQWQKLAMSHQGSDVYLATIPSQAMGSRVDYYLWARDKWVNPNSGTDPVGAPNERYYSFRIRTSGIEDEASQGITFSLMSSNPTKGLVMINFAIPHDRPVNLIVYDALGRKVKTLIDGSIKAGQYQLIWDRRDRQGRTVSSGIYFMKFSIENFTNIEKMILIK